MAASNVNRMISGGLSILSRVRSVPKGYAILLYHRLHDKDPCPSGLSISTGEFERQMWLAAEIGKIVPLSDMVSMVRGRRRPDRLYIAVTFDDGYEDVLRFGLPLFRRLSVPVMFFVSTSFIDDRSRLPWWDELHEIAGAGRSLFLDCVRYGPCQKERMEFIERASIKLKYSGIDPQVMMAGFRPAGYKRPEANGFADWEGLRKAARSGYVEVGGHTVTHPALSMGGLSEIPEGKRRLEDELGVKVRFFSYPFGENRDISSAVVSAAKKAGFLAAVTSQSGFNREGDDPMRLRRIKFSGNRPADFETNLRTGDIKRGINQAYAFLCGLGGTARFAGLRADGA
ncbi:MAG: polysaccharide deacetylase family protein [Candidatus Methylomirabilis sp.]|nr:polysaccharide deacetylase family protein [Deltaproteobacteria bacterium]